MSATPAGKDAQSLQQFSTTPGTNGANYIALSADKTAVPSGTTTLTGEYAAAGGGLNRAQATYAHTIGTGTTTLTKTFTANSNDGASSAVNKGGLFNLSSAGTMSLETLLTTPPTLLPADSVAVTWTVTY